MLNVLIDYSSVCLMSACIALLRNTYILKYKANTLRNSSNITMINKDTVFYSFFCNVCA